MMKILKKTYILHCNVKQITLRICPPMSERQHRFLLKTQEL